MKKTIEKHYGFCKTQADKYNAQKDHEKMSIADRRGKITNIHILVQFLSKSLSQVDFFVLMLQYQLMQQQGFVQGNKIYYL